MTESGYYYYTHSFTEDERQSLREFFGRDLLDQSYKELNDEQIDQISSRIMPRARTSIRVSDLLAPLRKFKALTDTEYSHLRSGSLEPQEQAVRLMEYLVYKGSYGLAALYLSLLASSESKQGLPAHYQLARELREIVHEYGVTDEGSDDRLEGLTNGTEQQTIPLRAAVRRLQGVRLSPETAQTLATYLNLPPHQRVPADLCELCCQWLRSRSTCDMMELVEGMVVTQGLGRYTTHLCGPLFESPRDLRNFLLTLGERWVEIAKYLGFSQEEIEAIISSYPGSIAKQVEQFLVQWKMPDSGQKTLPLMHKLKALAGIVEPKRDRADSLPSGRRPWLDDSGVPPRRLDPYTHPHKRAPPPPPPRSPDHHHNHHDHHNSHSGNHVHSFHHHQNCPFHDAVDERVEGFYDDYENAPYSYSGTLPVGHGAHVHLTIVSMGGGDESGYHRQSSRSNSHYKEGDDPVIEELQSDSESHSKPQRAIMGNEVTIPDQPTPSSLTKPPKPSRPPGTSPRSGGIKTEPMGNEVLMERSSSLDGSGFERGNMSTSFGNEVAMEGHPSSHHDGVMGRLDQSALGNEVLMEGHPSSRGGVGVEGTGFGQRNILTPLGSEVLTEDHHSGGTVSRGRAMDNGNMSLLGNEVLLEGPSSISNDHIGIGGSRFNQEDLSAPRGNEVLVEGSTHSTGSGGTGRGFEREKMFAPYGNEVGSPGLTNLGNKVPVGRKSSVSGPGGARRGWNAEGMIGNEVSLPAGGLAPTKQGVGKSLTPNLSSSLGLGNEVPMPGTRGRYAVGVVDNNLLSVHPSSLPSGTGRSSGQRRGVPYFANESESSDSGYTTVSGETAPGGSSIPRHRPLMSDSSSADSLLGVSSQNSVLHQPSSRGSLTVGTGLGRDGVVEGFAAPPNSRSPSPDNDFTSGDEEESSSFSSHPQLPVIPSQSNSSPAPVLNHSSLQAEAAKPGSNTPHSLSTASPVGSQSAPLSLGFSQLNTASHTEEQRLYESSNHPSSVKTGPLTVSNELSVGVVGSSGGVEGGTSDGVKAAEAEDGDNDLDFDGEDASSNPLKISPPRDLTLSPTPPPSQGGKEAGNDLSVVMPETPEAERVPGHAFMQTSLGRTPDNDATIAGVDPNILINDLSTEEGAAHETATTAPSRQPAESKTTNEVEEFCSEDILQSARERDGLDMLTALVESGATVNLPGPDGVYPIHMAVSHRHHETVLFLLDRVSSIEQRRSDGKTSLHLACLTSDFEMVQILVEKGADLAAQDFEGYTCMHLRETLETLNLVKYLVVHGAPFDTPSQESHLTPLMVCCHIGDETFETAQFLLSKGAKVNGYPQAGIKPLIIACTEGFEVLVDVLLEYNADINIQDHDGNTALLKACQGGFVSLAKKLCERRSDSTPNGANVNLSNNEGLTPVFAAVLRNDKELVVLLITHGTTVNCYKKHRMRVGGEDRILEVSPLSCAAAGGHMEMISVLVQNEACINATHTAMAPVTIAALCGQLAVVRYFLTLNDLDLCLSSMARPFMEAIKANQFECAEEIAKKKYTSLDEMLTAARQKEMRELVDSISQLQQKTKSVRVPQQSTATTSQASSIYPSSAPQANSRSTALPPAPQQVSVPSNGASTTENNLSEVGGVGDEDENNLDEEDFSLPSAVPQSLALALPSVLSMPNASGTAPSELKDLEYENNLNDPPTVHDERSSRPTLPVVSLPLGVPDPLRSSTVQSHVGDFADENNLNDENHVTPSGATYSLPAVLPASLTTVPNPGKSTKLLNSEENNLDGDEALPPSGSSNRPVHAVPSPTTLSDNNPHLGWGRVLSETEENNLDEEDPLSPLLQTTSGSRTASASLVPLPPGVQGPGPNSATSLPPRIEDNNLDEDDPVSPSALASSISDAASLPPIFQAKTSTINPSETGVTPSTPSLSPFYGRTLDVENDRNAGDDPIDMMHGARGTNSERDARETPSDVVSGARGGASFREEENHLNKPQSPPVAAQTTGDPVAAQNNLDTYSQNDENNLDEDDDATTTGLGTQQNTANSQVQNSLNPELSTTEVASVVSDSVAAQALNVVEEENILNDEEDAMATVAAVETSIPIESDLTNEAEAENNLNEDSLTNHIVSTAQGSVQALTSEADEENDLNVHSLTSHSVSRAQESEQRQSNFDSGQMASSPAGNSFNISGGHSGSDVDSAVANTNSIGLVQLGSDATAMNDLSIDQPSGSTLGNDLRVEGPPKVAGNDPSLQQSSPFALGSHMTSNLNTETTGGAEGAGGDLNNLDGEEFDQDEGLHNPHPVSHEFAAESGNIVSGRQGYQGSADYAPGTGVVQEQHNNLNVQNNLDADEDSTQTRSYPQTSRSVGRDQLTINNFDELDNFQPVGTHSLPPHSTGPSYQQSSTSLPPSNTPSAPLRAGAPTTQSQATRQHSLTEENQFDEDEENDFSRDDATSGIQDRPQPTSAPMQQHVRWVDPLEEGDRERSERGHPHPMSAPVGHSSGVPLRASVDSSSFATTPPASVPAGENLFAPRPKSPPTRAPSPPRSSPYNMLNMADGGLESSNGAGGSFEVLHDFAQICMVAADRIKGHEWLINKAIETGYDHLTEFFIKYFHEGMSLSIGGKLVTEFIGGDPSPLNFLLAGHFITEASFTEAARDLGQPEFMNDLAVAIHQFPGSDNLPYTGKEVSEALFSQSFSIGHRYPNPSSLWSPSSPSSPSSSPPTSSGTQQQPSFPGAGHQLGRISSSHSLLEAPSFSSSAPFTAPGSASHLPEPSQSLPSSAHSLPDSKRHTQGSSTSGAHPGSSLPAGPCPPPDAKLSLFSSSYYSSGSLPLHSTGHSLTEENTFDGESGAQNDLTTDDEDSGYFYPPQLTPMNGQEHGKLLGNEIDVKPVSYSQPMTSTTATAPLPPSSSTSTLPHNATPLTPSPPRQSHSVSQFTSLPSPSPPPDRRHPLSQSATVAPLPPAHSTESFSGKEYQRPISLTPSPDPIPSTLPKKPPTLVLKIKKEKPVTTVAPSNSVTNAVSPQNSSGFQSPRSLSPTPHTTQVTTTAIKPPQQAPHLVEVGSSKGMDTDVKQRTLPKEKDGTSPKTSRVTEMTKTTRTVSPGSPPTTHSKRTASSKPPPADSAPTSLARKKAQPPKPTRASTSAPTKTASPRIGSKLAAVPAKAPPSASPRVTKKTPSSTQAGGARETSSQATRAKKHQLLTGKSSSHTPTKPSSHTATRKSSPLQPAIKQSSTQPLSKSSKSSSLHPTSKLSSTHPTSKSSSSRNTRATKTPGTGSSSIQSAVPSSAAIASRGLAKSKTGKLGMSKSSLMDEEERNAGSSLSTTQEQATGSQATSPASSGKYSDIMVGTRCGNVISFPDSIIRDPDTCPLLKALAHRIRKWKMFGRYLGLSDEELDDIERTNHFTTERCFKMLVTWGRNFNGKYSELEAGIHNIMREDLVEDIRPLLPSEQTVHCSEKEVGNTLKISRFSLQDWSQNFTRLEKSVTKFLKEKCGNRKKILLQLSHEKLHPPLQIYLPLSSDADCDLTIVQELCFAAQCRSVSTVDLVFHVE